MRFTRGVSLIVGVLAIGGCSGSSSNIGQAAGGTAGLGGASGAGGASGGQGGGGGAPFERADKIDVLFVIDNSYSMADKQAVLRDTIPALVESLVSPAIDPLTNQPYFAPVNDIHFGVISSSLGGHGGDVCSPSSSSFNETQNDRAHLLPAERNLPSFMELGFLWWDPGQLVGGETNQDTLVTQLGTHVTQAGEQGCGYEASLEAWYRFLIDPVPPIDVVVSGGVIQLQGQDELVIKQRTDFLRPDSALVIVMLTDENDCSIAEEGQNWIAAQASAGGAPFHLPGGTSACDADPNDPCCVSCASVEGGPGCPPPSSDPACASLALDDLNDHLSLRCFRQKQRFGIEFLHPTSRYSNALSHPVIEGAVGLGIPNPLLATRNRELLVFVPIVGVPWQDLATSAALSGPDLEYLSASQLASEGRWDWLVPSCELTGVDGSCAVWSGVDEPDDPLMIESVEPRSGTNPATGVALVDPNGAPPSTTGPANGHEFLIPQRNNLQYACIFELPQPRDCATLPAGSSCECEPDPPPASEKSPLCQAADGSYSTVQRFAKAYPGTRILEVAKEVGDQAVVGSICPKSLDPGAPSFGYSAVVTALSKRLSHVLVQAD